MKKFTRKDPIFNIEYEKEDGRKFLYLTYPVDYQTAQKWLNKFSEKYVGKPFPNQKGFYHVSNPKIVIQQ